MIDIKDVLSDAGLSSPCDPDEVAMAPSQGGELTAWIDRQLAFSQERDEPFHKGITVALCEVRTGLRAQAKRG